MKRMEMMIGKVEIPQKVQMNKTEKDILNTLYEISDPDLACIREISRILKITEKMCEVYTSSLMSMGLIEEPEGILEPRTTLILTEEGKVQGKPVDYQEAYSSHLWQRMGSYGDGAAAITKDKWFPMGSYCKKCGVMIKMFKANPSICPKK